jgi:photosystem II stability/assembly factor-like uncharacterized protein
MTESTSNQNGGEAEGGCEHVPLYAQRNRNLEWRKKYFDLSRSPNQAKLLKFRNLAWNRKLDLIKRYGRRSGKKAGYDPAGAGSPWYSVGPRNVNGRIRCLAIHPTDPQTVYAGAAAGGVWKTIDAGQSWDSLWDTQESLAIGAIAISSSSPNVIYVGTGEYAPGWGGTYGGVGCFVSTDSGVTWSKRPAVQSRNIGKLVVDPTNDQRLWVSGDQGLERSEDGGVTWVQLETSPVADLVLDPLNPNTVFIAIAYDGYYRSTDSGDNFTLPAGAPTGGAVGFPQMAIGKSGSHRNSFIAIMSADVVQTSIDGGATFTVVPGAHPSSNYPGWCNVVAVAPDDENVLFWGGVGLDRTGDGTNWTGLPVHADQHVVAFAPSNSNIVYVGNDGGVWRSQDKGVTIEKASNGMVITQFYNINFWSTLSNVLGGGAQDNGVNLTTSALSWNSIFGGDGGWILIDSTDPRVIYTESQNGNIVKSTDGGKSWVAKQDGIVGPRPWEGVLHMDPNDHLRIFYGTDRVLRSTDGITTAWTESSQSLSGSVTAIWNAPSNSNRVYAGTTSGRIYRSDDGGNTKPWAEKSTTLPFRAVTSISTTSDANTVLVSFGGLSGGARSESIFRSQDGGDNWTDISGDLPNIVANGVVIDPSDPNTLYLATDTGLFRSTNAGRNWLAFDNGIPNVPCTGLVVDVASKILYCGTFGRGAYKLDISPNVTKAPVDIYLRDNDLDTGERFPSPSGLADPLVPAPGTSNFWTSPDIKINHSPFFTKTGVFDGVDFDTALVHQDPYRGQTNRFYIQVQNRGWQSTSNVSVRAFIADASAGLPNLPNALIAPNFDLTSTASWTPVGPAKTIATLKPNRPVIVTWDFNVPVTEATHSCCLVVISSPDDQFTNTSTIISELVTKDKHATLKNLHVVDPGPGGMPPSKLAIDFHNFKKSKARLDVLIRPSGFTAGRIGLLLPKVKLNTDGEFPSRDVDVLPLCQGDELGDWYLRTPHNESKNKAAKEVLKLLERRLETTDRTRIFDFDTTTRSALGGIEIGPGETLKAVLVTRLNNDVYVTGPARLEIYEVLDGELVGGSTFQFGYDLPPPGTVPGCKRLRITADELEFEKKHGDGCKGEDDNEEEEERMLIAKVVLGDDPDRVSYRFLDREEEKDDDDDDDDDDEGGNRGNGKEAEKGQDAQPGQGGRGGSGGKGGKGGQRGQDGKDGQPGQPGQDGKDGKDGAKEKKPDEVEKDKKHQILFDGLLAEGDSLVLSILQSKPGKKRLRELYSRRFEGKDGIRSWLGEYEDEGENGLKRIEFGVDEIAAGGGGETD